MDETLEGWYTDPYARHEARWMSDGAPTPLVRDGQVEGHDPAPDGPFKVEPVRLGESNEQNWGADLRKADDVERRYSDDSNAPADAAWNAIDRTAPR